MNVELDERVALEMEAGVATLTLRRPEKKNALTQAMWTTIELHLARARHRDDLRVLVLQGSGGSFSAGADLVGVKADAPGVARDLTASAVRAIGAIADFPVPSVARIEGPCIGGGCSLALACDLRFGTPESIFGIPAVRHGLVYDEESISRLVDLIGPSRAARMLYTAERYNGAEAARFGLVDECVDDLDGAVARFVSDVLAADPSTVRATRRLLRSN